MATADQSVKVEFTSNETIYIEHAINGLIAVLNRKIAKEPNMDIRRYLSNDIDVLRAALVKVKG